MQKSQRKQALLQKIYKMNSPFLPGTTVAAYLRDSGGDEQDLSIIQQEQAVQVWCNQNNLVLLAIFRDEARPGSSVVGRAQFQKMIQYFRSPDCQAAGILLWRYSRFSRDIDDSQFYKADLRRRGYIIHSLNDNIPEGIDGRFFEAAVDWMNAKYLEDMKGDIKRGLSHILKEHGALPGRPPVGFKREPTTIGSRRDGKPHTVCRWVPDPEKWETCQTAWKMRAAGATLLQIHNATHLYTSKNSYTDFYSNPLYLGNLHYGDQVIIDYAPALIDQATWDAVQKISQKRNHPNKDPLGNSRRAHSEYILSGLLYCARCQSPLNGRNVQFPGRPDSWHYYICSGRVRRHDCDLPKIPRKVIEDSVLDALTNHILQPDNIIRVQNQVINSSSSENARLQGEINALERRLAEIRKKSTNLINAIAEGGHNRAMMQTLTDLEIEENQIIVKIADLKVVQNAQFHPLAVETANTLADRLKELIPISSPQELRTLLMGFVDRVTVDADKASVSGVIHYYIPESTDKESTPFSENGRSGKLVSGVRNTPETPSARHQYTWPFVIDRRDLRRKKITA